MVKIRQIKSLCKRRKTLWFLTWSNSLITASRFVCYLDENPLENYIVVKPYVLWIKKKFYRKNWNEAIQFYLHEFFLISSFSRMKLNFLQMRSLKMHGPKINLRRFTTMIFWIQCGNSTKCILLLHKLDKLVFHNGT